MLSNKIGTSRVRGDIFQKSQFLYRPNRTRQGAQICEPPGAIGWRSQLQCLECVLAGTEVQLWSAVSYQQYDSYHDYHYCECMNQKPKHASAKQQNHEWTFQEGFSASLAKGPSQDLGPAKSYALRKGISPPVWQGAANISHLIRRGDVPFYDERQAAKSHWSSLKIPPWKIPHAPSTAWREGLCLHSRFCWKARIIIRSEFLLLSYYYLWLSRVKRKLGESCVLTAMCSNEPCLTHLFSSR